MISVIIYVFNNEKYLYHCINSVLKQSYQNFEIICVDDASTDSSVQILEYFSHKDSRINFIKNESYNGIGQSKNIGIDFAHGDYILFLEGDDWYSLDALEILFDEANSNNLDILMFKKVNFYEDTSDFKIDTFDGMELLDKFDGKIFNHWDLDKSNLFKLPLAECNNFYSKSFLEDNAILFTDKNTICDNIFSYKVFIKANRISVIDKYFYNSRRISDSSDIDNSVDIFDFSSVYGILDVFDNKEIYEYYKKEILNYIFHSILAVKYNQIEDQYKEKFFCLAQDVIKKFILEYDLYTDIKNNVDDYLLRFFKFDDIVNEHCLITNNDENFFNKNEIFSLWIPEGDENELPILAHLSLKSMILCGHDVVLYSYQYLNNVPSGVQVKDANEIIPFSKIFRYKEGHKTYSGFANLFRLKRLYEFGGTWLDLDILLIRNINEKFNDDRIIVSEPTRRFYLHPNNAILRFPKNDDFIKEMLDFALDKGNSVVHGETGPRLVSKMLKTSFKQYSVFLKHFNFNNILKWNDIEDYSKSPEDLLNGVNMDEIVGFHMFNTFFKKMIDSFDLNSFFGILKRIILTSNSIGEYKYNLKEYNILEINKNPDLKYLNTLNKDKTFTYSVLIDAKNLKKSEIYNIFHSIGVDDSYTIQTFVFSRTDLPNDKVKFADDFYMFSESFAEIYNNIKEYIAGDYIIPINKALMFNLDFFKSKNINSDIEQYILNKPDSYLNIFSKNAFDKLAKINLENIFNLPLEKMEGFKVEIFFNDLIYDYGMRSDDAIKLMLLIDKLSENPHDFNDIKLELSNIKFRNLIDKVSFYYYTQFENILSSKSYDEFKLKDKNSNLAFLTSFYLNKISKDYQI